ncbi:GTP-binding protein EngA [hydrothermal vent metagenome]|uniref:GTPase Der n=1 Tax=hydrothermal vent metagenome TaxID=652676 RepID=A0A1W1C464_9ZZZZ
MKKIAIIGRPNVGKSSLFNRLLKQRDAIISDMAGTTRDVKRRIVRINDKEAELLDTGGLDKGCELYDKIKEKSLETAHKADIILYMVDGKGLPEEEDKKLFYDLQGMGKEVALVVNKIDNDKMKEKLWEFYEFGTEDIFGISVAHNRSINALLEWVYEHLPEEDRVAQEEEEATEEIEAEFDFEEIDDEEDYFEIDDEEVEEDSVFAYNDNIYEHNSEDLNHIKVAIIGRPNVGKSSLLNALLKQERSVVSSVAGTTIDPIDESITYNDKQITFVDTAGIRRRGKIEGIEKYALMRTTKMLENANIALLVLDASEGFRDLDEKIAGLIDKHHLGAIIVLNKWDIADKERYEEVVKEIRDRFKFLSYAPVVSISAKTKLRVERLYEMILKVNDNYSQRIPTSRLNEVLEWSMRKHPLPAIKGQVAKIYYATQYDIRPPKIALIMNKPRLLHFTYRRYLKNQLREAFDLEGTPILFKAKRRGE